MIQQCNICRAETGEPIYTSSVGKSITSMCQVLLAPSKVYGCNNCAHLVTPAIVDIDKYYAESYNILANSEDEDQIVSFPNGEKEYRFKLQVDTFFNKIQVKKNSKILDYGCAKSTTLKKICAKRRDIVPYLYDVSENYIEYWSSFVESSNWQICSIKNDWKLNFDIVTSFFSLEHVSEPLQMMATIHSLLKEDGYFYCIVPNVQNNIADFVVADHVNHFSEYSLRLLMQNSGFKTIEIDTSSHYGAFIVLAQKTQCNPNDKCLTKHLLNSSIKCNYDMSKYWVEILGRIRDFEEDNSSAKRVSIYGSGFYGTYIATALHEFEKIECFIDQNPYRQEQTLLGKPIVPVDKIDEGIECIYVGLNPKIARSNIEAIKEWEDKKFKYHYL